MTLRDYRLSAGLTQVQVAKKLRVVQTCVSGWEVGRRTPNENHIKKMAKLYGQPDNKILDSIAEVRQKIDQ